MVKTILSILAGLSILLTNYKQLFISVDEVVIKTNDNIYYKYSDHYSVSFQDIVIYEDDNNNDLSFCMHNNYIYLLKQNDNHYLIYKYSLSGNLINIYYLYDAYSNLEIINIDNDLYLYGGININILKEAKENEEINLTNIDLSIIDYVGEDIYLGLDGFLMKLDDNLNIIDLDIYKGLLDEEFSNIYLYNNDLFLIGKKGVNSSGIYGNANGNYFVIRLEEEIIFRQYFEKEIIFFKINNEYISICTNEEIYLFNSDNSLISGLNLEREALFVYALDNLTCLVIDQNKGYLIDIINYEIYYEFDINGYDFYGYSDYLYYLKENKGYVLDLVDLSDYKKIIYPKYYNQVNKINGLYGEYKLNNVRYDQYFDKIVFGTYFATYYYHYLNLYFEMQADVKVLEEENVIDGGIYPLGYHLFFNGIGYLNDKLIYQNHEISEAGSYILRCEGINKTKEIKFIVSEDQTRFSDDLMGEYDLYTYLGSKIKIDLDLDIDINKIIVNDQLLDVYKEDGKSYFYLDILEKDNGFLIKYGIDENNQEYNINYFIRILGIDNINLGIQEIISNSNDDLEIDINIYQGNKYLRLIILNIDGNKYYYPVGDNNIFIDDYNFVGEDFKVSFGLYNGSKCFDEVELFRGNIKNIGEIIKVEIINKEEYIEDIRFIINGNNISYIDAGNYYLELAKKKDYKILIISIIIGIISFVITMIIRYKRWFKKTR